MVVDGRSYTSRGEVSESLPVTIHRRGYRCAYLDSCSAFTLLFNRCCVVIHKMVVIALAPSVHAPRIQSIESLMRTFLPADGLEPLNVDAQDSVAPAARAESTSKSTASARSNNGDGDPAPFRTRGLHSVQPGHLPPGKTTKVGLAGHASSSERNGIREPFTALGENDAVWDEVGVDGPSLVLSSPLELEPILPPSMTLEGISIANETVATTAGEVSTAGSAGVGASELGVTSATPNFPEPSMMATRCETGFSSGVREVDDRLWLVYDGVSAAGKGVISRVNAPDPYWIGRASSCAVCPYPHSIDFCSSFESANLLRAVQVCEIVGGFALTVRPSMNIFLAFR